MTDKLEELKHLMKFLDIQMSEILGERPIFSIVIKISEEGAYHMSNIDMEGSIKNMEITIANYRGTETLDDRVIN